jgi:hypothetical protein
LAYFKLGYSCVTNVPQKRPQMKEVLQVLEKIPSTLSYYYSHWNLICHIGFVEDKRCM